MTNRDWLERPFLIGHTNQKGIRGKIVSNERESPEIKESCQAKLQRIGLGRIEL